MHQLIGGNYTVSAFADEKDKNATQHQNNVQQKTTGSYYAGGMPLKAIDLWIQTLSKKEQS
ncbi:TPA: hypothetical protein QCU24_003531 [Bacillus cereus]|nr:hypothetical protein [Bacillus cereus]